MSKTVQPAAQSGSSANWLLRFVVFLASLGGLLVAGELAIGGVSHLAAAPFRPWVMLGLGLLLCWAMILTYRALVRSLEKRPPLELARSGAISKLLLGGLVGSSLFAGVYLILWLIGVLRLEGGGDFSQLPSAVAISVTAAVAEELVLRGALFRLLEEKLGTAIALLISAVLFGSLHLANPGATLASAASIAVEGGLLLALAYAATRSLWFPIGIHFGWNLIEGGIFGAAVSGHASHGVVHAALTGSTLLTGGGFGPEQSIVASGLSLLASLLLLGLAIRLGRFEPLRRRGRPASLPS